MTLHLHPTRLHPADEPTPGLRYLLAGELCIDPDPEITAILVEPVPPADETEAAIWRAMGAT